MWHGPTCPRVKAIEYYPDGSVKRVEFVDFRLALRENDDAREVLTRRASN